MHDRSFNVAGGDRRSGTSEKRRDIQWICGASATNGATLPRRGVGQESCESSSDRTALRLALSSAVASGRRLRWTTSFVASS